MSHCCLYSLHVVVLLQHESANWAQLCQQFFFLPADIKTNVLVPDKARKGVSKTRGSSCLLDPARDISWTISVQGTDFRCHWLKKEFHSVFIHCWTSLFSSYNTLGSPCPARACLMTRHRWSRWGAVLFFPTVCWVWLWLKYSAWFTKQYKA